jgi:site-specific recombinase XerD
MPKPPTNQGRRFSPEPLTQEELGKLFAAVPARSISGIRLRALIAVMSGAGLRVEETLNLEPRDIDLQDCTIRVREGKGGKFRTVGINAGAAAHLARWLDRRANLGLTARHRVFATYETGKIGRASLSAFIRTGSATRSHTGWRNKASRRTPYRLSWATDPSRSPTGTSSTSCPLTSCRWYATWTGSNLNQRTPERQIRSPGERRACAAWARRPAATWP